ncbi:dihydrofolate reductase [Alcaligenaceae bacterium CGII-47]|nr:dihydrofolate reductase [Alcaligenaceae bacterium CGII-47]
MPAPLIRLVVAYTDNRVIGRDNGMPWHLPADLAHFKRTTLGTPIIMGRNTWDSVGRALPGRRNLVISRNAELLAPGAEVWPSLEDALAQCEGVEIVCIIGGAQIFDHAITHADEIVATEIHAHIDGDVFFPALDPSQWQEVTRAPQPEENGLRYDFVTYRRIA